MELDQDNGVHYQSGKITPDAVRAMRRKRLAKAMLGQIVTAHLPPDDKMGKLARMVGMKKQRKVYVNGEEMEVWI